MGSSLRRVIMMVVVGMTFVNEARSSCWVPQVTNGYRTDSYNFQTGATTFTFGCYKGYRLSGHSSVDCLADGSFTNELPTCELVDCGEALQYALYAVVNNPTDTTTYNSKLIYSCQPGYSLMGSSERICKSDGTWTAEPTCGKDCQYPGTIAYGMVNIPMDDPRTVHYSCNFAYTLSGDDTRTCLYDGTWSGEQPTCVGLDCGEPPELENGEYTTTGTHFNDHAAYYCNTGYEISQGASRICQADAQWSAEIITCTNVGIRCPDITEQPAYGYIEMYEFYAVYTCFGDALLDGEPVRTCENGMWSKEPVCRRRCMTEELSDPANGYLVNATDWEATYRCKAGYTLFGERTRQCDIDGYLMGTAPRCAKKCKNLKKPKNGFVKVSKLNSPDAVADYRCKKGYTLQGAEQRVCDADGKWTGQAPECQKGTGKKSKKSGSKAKSKSKSKKQKSKKSKKQRKTQNKKNRN